MNHYPHHIGDYVKATVHLTNDEDLCYRRLIEMYYDTEKPIPKETQSVARRLRMGSEVVENVLKEFFVCRADGWHQLRCDLEIREYHARADRNRANGKQGGRPKKTQSVILGSPEVSQNNLNQNQNQNQNQNHVLKDKSPSGSRLTVESLPEDWRDFCQQERTDLNPASVFDQFKDYWTALPGAKGRKADWLATWRNWVRSQKKINGAYPVANKALALEARNREVVEQALREVGHG